MLQVWRLLFALALLLQHVERIMWKIKRKYFIFSASCVSLFILLSISQRIGTTSQKKIDIMQAGEFFLKIILLLVFITFFFLYYSVGKKHFKKAPSKINFKSWAKYVFLWGLGYSNIYTFIIMPFLMFCLLFFILPIKDSFTFTIDLLFSDSFYSILLPVFCFLGSNAYYFYYAIIKPWWQKN
jgi:hypothetical protein